MAEVSLGHLGGANRTRGRPIDAAKRHLHEALEMYSGARDPLNISMGLTSLAFVANDEGQQERAARLLGAAARMRDQVGGGVPPELAGRWGDPEADARRALGEPGPKATPWIARRLWGTRSKSAKSIDRLPNDPMRRWRREARRFGVD
jgi:hypothetical protein